MTPAPTPRKDVASSSPVPFRDAVRVWVRVACLSFGGPAGQIAVLHRILVEEKRWIGEARFLHALNFCMLLPGPEAQQLATYIGWLLHRVRGGLVAGLLFVLPGFVSILALSLLYATLGELPWVEGLFLGLKAAVLAVVVQAVIRIGRRALANGVMRTIATLSFLAIFFLEVPFPLIVLGAALVGLAGGLWFPARFSVLKPHEGGEHAPPGLIDGLAPHTAATLGHVVRTAALWLPLWLAPVAICYAVLGADDVFTQLGAFFSKAAVVTFGGAYAVLAYVAQQAVETYGWLQPGEMLDGLGMAETTPGPLIQVVQFVGFQGALRDPGSLHPLMAGTLASVLVTWVTFAPCFLWIFAGAPFVETLRGRPVLNAALSSITAAVVGVVLNLAVWFSLHVLFAEVHEQHVAGFVRVLVPDLQSLQPVALVLALGAAVALLRFRTAMLATLLASGVLGMLWRLAVE